MPRINEHKFSFENIDYKLTFYPKESAVIYVNEKKYTGNKSELLRKYITSLDLGLNLHKLTTQQLSHIVLKHFSEQNNSNFKKTSPKVESKKKDKQNSSSKLHYDNEIEIEKLNLSKNFKVVMICAGGKNDSFFTAYPNEKFVNNQLNNFEHHPDEIMNDGITPWREYLNKNQSDANLKKAYELYKPKNTGIYTRMYNKYLNRFFILSAGWGLVKSDFKLPNYDITFSTDKKSPKNTRRNQNMNMLPIYIDFNQLIVNINDDIIYVGGEKYLELFYKLTRNLPNRKIIYYNLKNNPKPLFGNYLYRRYFIKYSTNWHYELAEKIANGIIP